VLCVDDEPGILQALRRVLRTENYLLLTAASGGEAFAVLQRRPVSLLIVDQRMPDMDGIDLLARCATTVPDTTRILLTGYADTANAVRATNQAQPFRYLSKPWDDAQLRRAVIEGLVFHDTNRCNHRLLTQLRERNTQLEERQQVLAAELHRKTGQNQKLVQLLEEMLRRMHEREQLLRDLQQRMATLQH
jgi:response regulator RpfG family c-di-GMP phosphodiesterase